MSIKLQKEHINLSEVLCTKYCRTTVENDVIVPDIKPDVLKILGVSTEAVINQKNIQTDRLHVQGVIRVNILYIPDGDVLGKVKSINTVQDYSHSIDVPGAKPGMDSVCEVECETPEFTLINSRKINIRSRLGIGAKLIAKAELDVATDIEGDEAVQIKGKHFKIANAVGETERDILIKEQLEIPQGKPCIAEILRVSAKPVLSELKISDNKAVAMGEVKIGSLYCGDNEGEIQFTEHTVPISEILEIDGLRDGMDGEIEFTVKDIYSEIRQDSDGDKRVIGVELSLSAQLRMSEMLEFDAIEDAYGIDREIKTVCQEVNIEQLIDKVCAQAPIKEQILVPDYMPELFQICDHSADINIDSVSIEENRVTVSGAINCRVLYISTEGDMPLTNLTHTAQYSHTFEIPGIDAEALCDAKADISHLGYIMNGSRSMELRIIAELSLKAMKAGKTEIVAEMEWDEEKVTEPLPSMIIYFVQGGESLWDIAKRYRATPDKIIEDNGTEKDILKKGNSIYIYR